MTQKDSSPPSPSDTDAGEHIQEAEADSAGQATNITPFFPITGQVTLKPTTPERGRGALPASVARLIGLASLSAALLAPLSGCDSIGDVPCPVPTPTSSATSVPDGTPTARCTTSRGTHYVWIRNRGGWVESDDGIHPNSSAHGVGVDETHSGSTGEGGVGDGHGGSGHGGGDGG